MRGDYLERVFLVVYWGFLLSGCIDFIYEREFFGWIWVFFIFGFMGVGFYRFS